MTASAVSTSIPVPASRKGIEELSHQKFTACYQCQKCSNGCPATFAMDIMPHRLMHMLQLGLVDEVLRSQTIWACASCQTCTTRCPNSIDVAHVMEVLRRVSIERGLAAQKNARLFNAEFLNSVKSYGRLYELGMVGRYTLRSQGLLGLLKQSATGLTMVTRGKLKLLPHSFLPPVEVKRIFKQSEGKKPKQ